MNFSKIKNGDNMKKIFVIALMSFLVSCSSWQTQVVDSSEKCRDTGKIKTEEDELHLGKGVYLVEITKKPVFECKMIATYKNIRVSNITQKELACRSHPKCYERWSEEEGSRDILGEGSSVRFLTSENPDIKVDVDSIWFYREGRLAATAKVSLNRMNIKRSTLKSSLNSIKCVDPDGSTAVYSNDIDLCLTREINEPDSRHEVKVKMVE